MKRLFGKGERISPEVSRLLMAYLSSPSATLALIGRRGVPETRATPAKEEEDEGEGLPEESGPASEEATKTEEKDGSSGFGTGCLDHTDHQGHSHENILLSVYLINAT